MNLKQTEGSTKGLNCDTQTTRTALLSSISTILSTSRDFQLYSHQ